MSKLLLPYMLSQVDSKKIDQLATKHSNIHVPITSRLIGRGTPKNAKSTKAYKYKLPKRRRRIKLK